MLEYFLIASTSFLVSMAVLARGRGSNALENRLSGLKRSSSSKAASEAMSAESENVYPGAVRALRAAIGYFGKIAWLRALLKESGTQLSSGALFLQILACALGCMSLIAITTRNPMFAGLGGVGAGTLPIYLLSRKRTRRLVRIETALPGAIDLMARSLRAGHSLGAAFEILANSCPQPLSGEFAHVSRQQKLGVMFRETMLELLSRVPSQDLRFLVTGVLLQHESGGDLTEMLDTIREVIADRARVAGLMQVHSAQGRFTGWVLSALPIGLLILMYFINPLYASVLWTEHAGRKLLLLCLVLVAVGLGVIRKIVAVKK